MKDKLNNRTVIASAAQQPLQAFRGLLRSFLPRNDVFVFAITIFLFGFSNPVFAQVSATLKADSNHIEIGDWLHFKLAITAPKNTVVEFPNFAGDTLNKMEIVSRDKIDTATIGENILFTQTIVASAYDSGAYKIAPFAVYFSNEQKTTDSVFTNDFEVSVSTIAVDTSKAIKPIKAPLKVAYEWREFVWWIVAAVVLIALVVAYFLYRKYKKKPQKTEEKPKPKEPAHVWALNELVKLEAEKLWQNDQHKEYYSRLSETMRSYLEYRYDVLAMESTTDEIADLLAKLSISNELKNRLLETLRLADFAKFAKMTPMPEQNMRSMENAKAFVERTKLVVETVQKNKQEE